MLNEESKVSLGECSYSDVFCTAPSDPSVPMQAEAVSGLLEVCGWCAEFAQVLPLQTAQTS